MSAWEEIAGFEKLDETEQAEALSDIYVELSEAGRMRFRHDRDAFLAHGAGDAECLALGHKPNEYGEWETEGHVDGWNGDLICIETQYTSACSYCESADCVGDEYLRMSERADLWALVRAE